MYQVIRWTASDPPRVPVTFLFLLLLGAPLLTAGCSEPEAVNYLQCGTCHRGIERISESHDFECISCHVRPEDRTVEPLTTHERIIRNPSDPAHVKVFCLSCHEREIRRIESSLHSTMAGIINQTRYLWGAQAKASPAVFGLSGPLRALPEPDPLVYPEEPRHLVDDFLRRRCLRCHIHAAGVAAPGLYRAAGCAACHVLYADDGRYRGGDETIGPSSKPYPEKHAFTKRIPNSQCLRCHNQNHVGADYEGLFERDYRNTYRSPPVDGRQVSAVYGLDYHHLARDVHGEKGLWCIDCHSRKDIMGDGHLYSYQMEVPKRTCSHCHGDLENPSPDFSDGAITEENGVPHFISRNDGEIHKLPLFSKDATAHGIRTHGRIRCSACHAQWSYQDYGYSVIREDMIEGDKWFALARQGDPDLEKILTEQTDVAGIGYPVSRDRLSGRVEPGIWSVGWRLRRWEWMPLGVDHGERIAILRPLYQYLITYVDRLGNVPLDSMVPSRGDGRGRGWSFMPYVPHTIAPAGRSCESCHLDRVSAGLGIQEVLTDDTRLTVPSPPAIEEMRLLNARERGKLLEPSQAWRRARREAATGDFSLFFNRADAYHGERKR